MEESAKSNEQRDAATSRLLSTIYLIRFLRRFVFEWLEELGEPPTQTLPPAGCTHNLTMQNPIFSLGGVSDVEASDKIETNSRDDFTLTSGLTVNNSMIDNRRALRILRFTANYWPEGIQTDGFFSWNTLDRLHFIFARIVVVCAIAFSLYILAVESKQGYLVGITIALTFFLDALSVLPTQYLNHNRLQSVASLQDCRVYEECNTVAERFAVVCVCAILVSISCGIKDRPDVVDAVIFLTLAEFYISMYLTFNLWFLLMDLNSSIAMIEKLIYLTERQELSMEKFNEVRSDIHERVEKSKLVSDFILVPCVASVFAIVVLIFHLDLNGSNAAYTVGWTSALIKEMIFICVAFCYVATVNHKADLLTEKLSSGIWKIGGACDRDVERLTMCVSSLTKPISFTLLFKRVSWQNVLVGSMGIVVTISIGLIRSSITL